VPSAVSRWLVFQVTMMGRSGQLDWSEEQEATLFPLNQHGYRGLMWQQNPERKGN